MSGIFGISMLPVSTVHTTVSPEGPIAFPRYIPQEVANGKYVADEFIPTNALKAPMHRFLKRLLLKTTKAARHV
ncbi:hypothetical protein IJ596_03930 [bacterium]|nr:hypothetical protein [bacterium]